MTNSKKVPKFIIKNYIHWKKNSYKVNKEVYDNLNTNGQSPEVMIIACCDSRVNVSSIMSSLPGECFIHRNIANIVPEYDSKMEDSGTPAAIEFAVKALEVSHIVILGHSNCGGVKNGYHLCNSGQENQELKFTSNWLKHLKPAYNLLNETYNANFNIKKLEKLNIINSLNNLRQYPFILEKVQLNQISLHGAWIDIGTGDLELLNQNMMSFEQVNPYKL